MGCFKLTSNNCQVVLFDKRCQVKDGKNPISYKTVTIIEHFKRIDNRYWFENSKQVVHTLNNNTSTKPFICLLSQ